MNQPIVLKGAKAICSAVGINYKRINHYVEHNKLPAYKIDNSGPWLALPRDLELWAVSQRNSYLPFDRQP